MIAISMSGSQTITIAGGAGKCYELYFDNKGNPVAFRVKLTADSQNDWLLHKLRGARMPRTWGEKSLIHEHNNTEFQSKLIGFMHVAAAS